MRSHFLHISQILEGNYFWAYTCRACIRTRANTGKYFWGIIYVLVSCQGVWHFSPPYSCQSPELSNLCARGPFDSFCLGILYVLFSLRTRQVREALRKSDSLPATRQSYLLSGWSRVLGSPRGATEYENVSKLEIRKKIRKKYKIPHSGLGPENTKKKIRKNYKNGEKMANFVIFLYFFRIFGAQPGMGDFVFFSYFQF